MTTPTIHCPVCGARMVPMGVCGATTDVPFGDAWECSSLFCVHSETRTASTPPDQQATSRPREAKHTTLPGADDE